MGVVKIDNAIIWTNVNERLMSLQSTCIFTPKKNRQWYWCWNFKL